MRVFGATCAALALTLGAQRAAAQDAARAPEQEGAVRARVELLHGRTVTGDVRFDDEGRLTITSRATGPDALLDFDAVRRFARVDSVGRAATLEPDPGDAQVLRPLRQQVLFGELVALGAEELEFESEGFGWLVFPREWLGVWGPAGAGAQGSIASAGAGFSRWELGGAAAIGADGFVALERPGDAITRAQDLAGTEIDVTLAWTGPPEFRIVVGEFGDDERSPAVTLTPWGARPTLFTWGSGELEVFEAELDLEPDSGAIVKLRAHGDGTVELVRIEPFGGAVAYVPPRDGSARLRCGVAMDRVRVEALGQRMQVEAATVRSTAVAVAGGVVEVDRVLRGTEVDAYDPEDRMIEFTGGRTPIADLPGIRFVPRESIDMLDFERPSRGSGRLTLTSGEMLEVNDMRVAAGSFVVRSPFMRGEHEIPFESVHSLDLTMREQRALAGANVLDLDGANVEGTFRRLERDGDGWRAVHSPLGFLSEADSPVRARFAVERREDAVRDPKHALFPARVQLASGDAFPAAVVDVDTSGWTFRTPFTNGEVAVPHGLLAAVLLEHRAARRLLAGVEAPGEPAGPDRVVVRNGVRMQVRNGRSTPISSAATLLAPDELERALLVPRSQKDDPGTYLLIAKNADLLRTNLVGLADESASGPTLEVEGGAGGNVRVPLPVVALAVRLGEGRTSPADAEGAPLDPWVVAGGGDMRVTGRLAAASQTEVAIDHAVLGRVTVPFESVRELRRGGGVEPPFANTLGWRTERVPEPRLGK